jgi:hypothetical protein
MYLEMIWIGVSLKIIPDIFWPTICDIDEAVDNINFPSVTAGIMKLVNDWSMKCKDFHGFTTSMGSALAVNGFVVEIKKPNVSDLDGQEIGFLRNHKEFWGLISLFACDSNAKA